VKTYPKNAVNARKRKKERKNYEFALREQMPPAD
jgi:hypothetical protein